MQPIKFSQQISLTIKLIYLSQQKTIWSLHTKYQKAPLMRCSKSHNFYHMLKIIQFLSLHLWLFLLSLSFSSFFLYLTSSSQFSPLSSFFFFFLLLSFSWTSTSPFFFPPFFFFFFVTFSLRLLYLFFFFPLSLSLSIFFFFSPLRSLPLRSATVVEFGLAVEFNLTNKAVVVEISYSDLPLFFFFFFFCGFWIWNLLEDLVIVVVVCGSCCNGGCWFLVGGGCH